MPQTIAIVPQRRSIGGVVAQVTIRESYRNDMEITQHPIENGANISDHAYLRPREIELEIGWDGTQNPADVFNQLKQLQATRQPFTIYTDRDVLSNMLVSGIATVTDQRTAYSWIGIVRCRQVNLVSTQSTVVGEGQFFLPGTDTPLTGASTFQAGTITTPQIDQGTQTLKPGTAANLQDPNLQQTFGAAGVQGLPGSPSGSAASPPA